jgi:tetratricopeptide (TPR) repeat protein
MVHARILLEKAATADPTSFSPYIHSALSDVYRELGNSNQAIAEALLSLKYNPNEKDTYYTLALCLKDARRYDEAIQYLTHYAGMISGKRKEDALELVRQLEQEKTKLDQFSPEAPDYLDQFQSKCTFKKFQASEVLLRRSRILRAKRSSPGIRLPTKGYHSNLSAIQRLRISGSSGRIMS